MKHYIYFHELLLVPVEVAFVYNPQICFKFSAFVDTSQIRTNNAYVHTFWVNQIGATILPKETNFLLQQVYFTYSKAYTHHKFIINAIL